MKKFLVIPLICICTFAFAQSDTPCGAPAISVNNLCTFSTVNIGLGTTYATNAANFGAITCGASGPDVWYSFVAPASGNVTIQTSAGNIIDGVMALYSSNCSGTYSLIACDDDSGPGLMPLINATGLTGGLTYYIRLWEWFGIFTGYFQVCVIDNGVAPPPTGNQNCASATGICSNASFSANSSGAGIQELNLTNSGCLVIEHQSSWYTFTAQTTGSLAMTIAPVNGTDDYDFALWGPFSACAPNSTPARCSYSALGGNTGMQSGSGDVTEDAFGDAWVDDITITAGEDYVLLIDNWSVSNSPFNLTWGGTSSLDCAVVLPIELVYFKVFNNEGVNALYWMTASEINNNYFTVERSSDGVLFETIAYISGAGTSNSNHVYSTEDRSYQAGINYYRLTQTDYDGMSETFDVISIDNSMVDAPKIIKVVNLMGQEVDIHASGIKYIVYEDGEVVKRINQ